MALPASKSLEGLAIEALLEGDHVQARALLDQCFPSEALRIRDAARQLATYADEVYTHGRTEPPEDG